MSFPLPDLLAKRAEISPDRVALEPLHSHEQLSYRELHERAGRSAALLAAVGVCPSDRVAVLCRNRIEFFELLFACARLGAILVPLNWRMPAGELTPILSDCGAGCLLYGKEDRQVAVELASRSPALPGLALLDLDDDGPQGFRARREDQLMLPGRATWPAEETWYLLYTSGTTGLPKAVFQTYGMALVNYINISLGMGLRGDDTTLNYLPLFHTGGINLVSLPALIMGARVLITPGFELESTVDLLEHARIDSFFGVPAVYQAISLHPRFDQLDLSRVRTWGCGGAPMPPALLQQFAVRGATVLNGMGMTETGPTVFLMDTAHVRDKPGSVGKPQLLASVRLVDADGKDVPIGETGELWFSGPGITPGYFNRPEDSAATLAEDRWLRSGDLGRQDEDGYYYIVGRLNDMYISGGENVYAAEVEARLVAHPDILEAAVTGVADSKWGEVGCAWLLPRPGHALPDEPVLGAFVRQQLAAYKVPRYFLPVTDFPRTAAGKVQKHLLPKPVPE